MAMLDEGRLQPLPQADQLQPDLVSYTAAIGANATGGCIDGARKLCPGRTSLWDVQNLQNGTFTKPCYKWLNSMVYGRYTNSIHGIYKPTYNWGAPSCKYEM